MSALLPLIIQLIGGAAGGNVLGAVLKNLPVSKILATVLGAVGGIGGGQLVDVLGVLESVIGDGGGGLLGTAGSAAGGGAMLTLVVGLIKKVLSGGADTAE